jgi:hypothetical protein
MAKASTVENRLYRLVFRLPDELHPLGTEIVNACVTGYVFEIGAKKLDEDVAHAALRLLEVTSELFPEAVVTNKRDLYCANQDDDGNDVHHLRLILQWDGYDVSFKATLGPTTAKIALLAKAGQTRGIIDVDALLPFLTKAKYAIEHSILGYGLEIEVTGK